MSADQQHLLTGAYAADALSDTERPAFERHLGACPPCAAEARELRGAAARTYQLWVVDRSGPRPAGLVEVPAGGRVTRLLEGRVTGSEQVAMTVERRGGVARPTSEPVVVVELRA